MTARVLVYRILIVIAVIGFFIAWTAVPETELVLESIR